MSDERLLALYEAVEGLITQAQELQTTADRNIKQATSKSEDMTRVAISQAQARLDKMTEMAEQTLKPEVVAARQEAQRILDVAQDKAVMRSLWILGITTVICVGVLITAYVFFDRAKANHKHYWQQERLSLFGAKHVISEAGDDYLLFDEDYEINLCTRQNRPFPNCASISERD